MSLLATALASGSVAAIVTHFLTSDRERRGLLRQKAEDLYISVEALENSWGLTVLPLMKVVRREIDYNQYLDICIKLGESTDGALNRRIHMLTEIYFPSARPERERLVSNLDRFNEIRAAHKEAYREGHFGVFDWQTNFVPAIDAVTGSFDAYKKAVVQCAQRSFAPLKVKS